MLAQHGGLLCQSQTKCASLWTSLWQSEGRHKKSRTTRRQGNHYKLFCVVSRLTTLDVQLLSGLGGLQKSWGSSERWESTVSSLCKEGHLEKAVDTLFRIDQQGNVPSVEMYRLLLKACTKRKALVQAKRVHAHLANHGLESTGYLGESVVNTLAKCCGIEDALEVFQGLPHRTVVSWTALISGYTQAAQPQEALRIYWHMLDEGVRPDTFTFVSLLKACGTLGDLELGKCIHEEAVKYRCASSLIVGTCLIDMYAKCGSMENAQDVFQHLLHRDVISWNVMLAAHVQQGKGDNTLRLYRHLLEEQVSADDRTFVSVLQACGTLADQEEMVLVDAQPLKPKSLMKGKAMHFRAQKKGYQSDTFVGNALVSMYGKCGSTVDAQQAFDALVERDIVSWNALIAGYAQGGRMEKAFQLYDAMQEQQISPDARTFVGILQACCSAIEGINSVVMDGESSRSDILQKGKVIHAESWRKGYESDSFLGSSLITIYGKCWSILDAQNVFDRLSCRNVVSWTSMLAAYVQQGNGENALQIYTQLQEEGVSPNGRTLVLALQACGMLAEKDDLVLRQESLKKGRAIHAEAWRRGCDLDGFVGNAVVSMYAKCGAIMDAQYVFEKLLQRDGVSWNTMLAGYSQQGECKKALQLYDEMLQEAVSPDARTLVSMLQACGSLAENEGDLQVHSQSLKLEMLRNGKALHAEALRMGYESDVFVGNAVINVYGKCGSIVDARRAFDSLPLRDVVTWNAMLASYVQQGKGEEFLNLYYRMYEELFSPDARTFVSAFQACGSLAENETGVLVDGQSFKVESLQKGKVIHAIAGWRGYESDAFVASTLISMYGKCRSISDAQQVFDRLTEHSTVSWTATLMAYLQQNQGESALEIYHQMHEKGDYLDVRILVSALHVCSALAESEDFARSSEPPLRLVSFQRAKALHAEAWRNNFDSDIYVVSALITLYGSCGSIADAQNVFDGLSELNTASWTAMLAANVQLYRPDEALQLYDELQESGITLDAWNFVNVLRACSSLAEKEVTVAVHRQSLQLAALHKGKAIHAEAQRHGYESYVFVGNALISMYAKCGSLLDAQTTFDEMPQRDVVSWNAILTAHAQQGEEEITLQLYGEMLQEGFRPDDITGVCILQACGNRGALDICREIHRTLLATRKGLNYLVVNTLIYAYGKCGAMLDAQEVFDGLPQPDVVSWTTLITGYTRQGNCKSSLQHYRQMKLAGVKPNGMTFLSVLCACSHGGILEKAVEFFESMCHEYDITPALEHYGVMVDLFCRGGYFTVVEEFLSKMPIQPDLSMYLSLLAACRKHGNVEMGKRAFDCALHLQPNALAAYSLMSNIYAHAGMWECVKKVQDFRPKPGMKKKPAQSWIQHEKTGFSFTAGECKDQEGGQVFDLIQEIRSTLF